MQSLRRAAADNSQNQEAESAYVRRTVWGVADVNAAEGDNVNDTVLGDMTTVHHHAVKESGIGKLLLGAGLLATGIGAPIGAAILMSGAKDAVTPVVEKPVEKPVERPAVDIGGYELRLGK